MKNLRLLIQIEERINLRRISSQKPGEDSVCKKINDEIMKAIDRRMVDANDERALYHLILVYIKRLKNDKYLRKNGEINEAAFYRDAFVDKSTWSDIKWGKIVPNKKTLLKLIIALHLSEDEANELMALASNSLNQSDPRDLVILALLDMQCYDPYDVYDALEEYGKNGKYKFDNIYDVG